MSQTQATEKNAELSVENVGGIDTTEIALTRRHITDWPERHQPHPTTAGVGGDTRGRVYFVQGQRRLQRGNPHP